MIRAAGKTAFSRIPTFFNRYSSSSYASATMSERHLTKGSSIPPLTEGLLRVYNMRFCPYAQRTILVLNAKKIPYEIVNINLTEKPEWLTSKSPLGKVPALEIKEGVTIYESLVTAEYIEDAYSQEPQLVSKDPLRKAIDKLIVENFNRVIIAFYKCVINKDTSVEEQFFGGLDELQSSFIARQGKFFHGDYPGMVDYMIWPWIERLGLMVTYGGDKFVLDETKYDTLIKWIEAMKQIPAIKDYYLSTEIHEKFVQERANGNYDFLLK